jgi:hypothetical protein
VDVAGTVQFLLDRQARAEAEIQQIRSVLINVATLHAEVARRQERLERVVAETAEVVAETAEIQRRGEEERRKAEEENRLAHLRFEEAHSRFAEAHQDTEERFNALTRMMDQWIRERRTDKPAE